MRSAADVVKGDHPRVTPTGGPDVTLYQADALPYGGTWCGDEGMERFFLEMSRVWESFHMVEQEFLTTGAPVVVLTQVRARARATGRDLEFPILQQVTVEDGQIREVRPFYWDTQEIADACRTATRQPGKEMPACRAMKACRQVPGMRTPSAMRWVLRLPITPPFCPAGPTPGQVLEPAPLRD